MLLAFFDDSGTDPNSPVVAFGGLLGTEEQWELFDEKWSALLKDPLKGTKPPLAKFHLSPCQARRGDFIDYKEVESDRVIYLFRRIILDIGLVSIAAAVDRVAWKELVIGKASEIFGDPEGFCVSKCVELLLKTIRFRKPGEKVIIGFDQGVQRIIYGWAKFFESQTGDYPEIDRIGFGRVSHLSGFQGADMVATWTYQYGQAWLKDRDNPIVDPHFKDFIKRDISTGIILDREMIKEMVDGLSKAADDEFRL